jgi:hypothetical protein
MIPGMVLFQVIPKSELNLVAHQEKMDEANQFARLLFS